MPFWVHRFSMRCFFLGLVVSVVGILSSHRESASQEDFRALYADLRERMERDLPSAVTYLETQIEQSPDSAHLNVLRHSLAMRLAEDGDTRGATAQIQKLLDYQIEHVESDENKFGIRMTIRTLEDLIEGAGRSDAFGKAVDRSFQALDDAVGPKDSRNLMPVSQLAVRKAQFLVQRNQTDQATELLREQLARLKGVNQSDLATEESMHAQVEMLSAMARPDRGNDAWREESIGELEEAVTLAIEKFPSSMPLQNAFADTQYRLITEWKQDDPDETKQRIDNVIESLERFVSKNPTVDATLRRIEVLRARMEAAKPVESLVGKPAPEWDIDAWVRPKGQTQQTLEGKVILLDFWAVWCGPCIATFPHLREWREEFGDKGFEIVGITQYYNYRWDFENERPERAEQELDPKQEREALEDFLAHHNLSHPVFVTPPDSQMASEYGVRGIPHVVLIDREGVVQLIKTGAGQATADEIHAKIKELIGAGETP